MCSILCLKQLVFKLACIDMHACASVFVCAHVCVNVCLCVHVRVHVLLSLLSFSPTSSPITAGAHAGPGRPCGQGRHQGGRLHSVSGWDVHAGPLPVRSLRLAPGEQAHQAGMFQGGVAPAARLMGGLHFSDCSV